jgi:hypothetical protein
MMQHSLGRLELSWPGQGVDSMQASEPCSIHRCRQRTIDLWSFRTLRGLSKAHDCEPTNRALRAMVIAKVLFKDLGGRQLIGSLASCIAEGEGVIEAGTPSVCKCCLERASLFTIVS